MNKGVSLTKRCCYLCAKVRNIIITTKEKPKKNSLLSVVFSFYSQLEGKYCKVMCFCLWKGRNKQKFTQTRRTEIEEFRKTKILSCVVYKLPKNERGALGRSKKCIGTRKQERRRSVPICLIGIRSRHCANRRQMHISKCGLKRVRLQLRSILRNW